MSVAEIHIPSACCSRLNIPNRQVCLLNLVIGILLKLFEGHVVPERVSKGTCYLCDVKALNLAKHLDDRGVRVVRGNIKVSSCGDLLRIKEPVDDLAGNADIVEGILYHSILLACDLGLSQALPDQVHRRAGVHSELKRAAVWVRVVALLALQNHLFLRTVVAPHDVALIFLAAWVELAAVHRQGECDALFVLLVSGVVDIVDLHVDTANILVQLIYRYLSRDVLNRSHGEHKITWYLVDLRVGRVQHNRLEAVVVARIEQVDSHRDAD